MYSNRSVLATSDTSTGYPFGLWLLVKLCDVQLKDFLRPQVFRRNHSHLLGAHLLILYAPSNGASGSEFWCDCSCARSYDGHRLIRTNEPMETLRSPRKSVHLVDGYKAPRRSKVSPTSSSVYSTQTRADVRLFIPATLSAASVLTSFPPFSVMRISSNAGQSGKTSLMFSLDNSEHGNLDRA